MKYRFTSSCPISTKPSNLANAMEALIGAVYLDQGWLEARKFVVGRLKPRLDKIKNGNITPDYKTLLQEFIQGEKKLTPVYQLIGVAGPDHEKQFTVEVMVEGEVLGKGTGKNKKSAEMEAAHSAWEKLKGRMPSQNPPLSGRRQKNGDTRPPYPLSGEGHEVQLWVNEISDGESQRNQRKERRSQKHCRNFCHK